MNTDAFERNYSNILPRSTKPRTAPSSECARTIRTSSEQKVETSITGKTVESAEGRRVLTTGFCQSRAAHWRTQHQERNVGQVGESRLRGLATPDTPVTRDEAHIGTTPSTLYPWSLSRVTVSIDHFTFSERTSLFSGAEVNRDLIPTFLSWRDCDIEPLEPTHSPNVFRPSRKVLNMTQSQMSFLDVGLSADAVGWVGRTDGLTLVERER